MALLAAVAGVLAVPVSEAHAAATARQLQQVRAETKKLKAELKALKAQAAALQAQTAQLQALTASLQGGLDSAVVRNPGSAAENWISADGALVPLTVQGGDGGIDIQQWLDPLGVVTARIGSEGSVYANRLFARNSLNLQGATENGASVREPLVNYWNDGELAWQSGLDVANSENGDFVLAAKGRDGGVYDVMYLRDYYPEGSVAIGEGIAPPLPGFRTQIGSPDESDWGALMLRIGAGGTGDALRVIDSAGTRLLSVDNRGRLVPADGQALRVLGDLRVRSTDITDPNGLVLNGNPTDTSTDFHVRNLFDPFISAYKFQIVGVDGHVFAEIRQDTGELWVPSGRVRLGDGVLVAEGGSLKWIAPGGAVSVLAGS